MAALSAAMLLPPATAAASQPEQQQQQQQGNRSRQQQQERQQELWEDLFSNPSQWWDNRPNKRNPTYPDFRHKASKQPLWVDNRHKPPWVESRLPTLYGHHHLDLDYDVSDAPSTQQHLQKERGHSSPTFLSSDDDLVRNLCDRGQLNMAIDVLSSMHTALSTSTYKSLLQACTKRKALDHAKQVQAHIALHKPAELTGIVGDNLVVTFAKCGAIEDARQISTTLRHRSVVSWTAMISACVECGNAQEALKMHQCMQGDNVEPNSYTYVSLFKACSIVQDLELGRKLHADARKKGLASGFFVGSALVSMYSKGGAIVEAEDVFSELSERDIVSWTAMLSAYIEQGQAQKALQLYRQMQDEGLRVDRMVFVIALQACTTVAEKEDALLVDGEPIKLMSLEIGQALHADAHKKDFASHCFVGTTLLSMYGKCGAITEAEALFGAISQRDLVSWRAMLSVYVELGQGEKALQLFRQMQENGMSADQLTYVIALQACAILGEKEAVVLEGKSAKVVALEIGRALLADVHMSYFALDTFIGTAQLTMYAKCGTLAEAEDAFCALSHRDVVSWTAMISSYMEQGQVEKALQLYSLMRKEGASPDKLTFVIVLQACATFSEKEEAFLAEGRSIKIKALEIGQALLADASMKGFASDVGVGTALLSMYGKCGVIMEAEDVFGKLSHRSVVSWNAMLLAYVEHSQGEKAFDLYRRMKKSRVIMNDATFICLLQACHETGSLELCKQVHFDIVSAGYDWMASVITTLIHAYGSCASMADAQGIFDELPEHERDVVSWNAYIAGLSGDGNIGETLHMFEKMKGAGIKPNEATFNAVLLACCRAGFVAKGVEYFESMSRDYDITPDLKHYGIMLDLLGRAGDFKRIEKMLERMPMQAPLTMWLSLLGACRMHGNVELAKQVFDHAVNLQPKQAAAYVLMSNIYAEAGLQQCAAEVEHFRHKNCVEKAWPELVG